MQRNRALLVALMLVFFLLGCSGSEAPVDPFANADPNNPVLAVVGGEKITKNYFEIAMILVPEQQIRDFFTPPDYEGFLQELIHLEIYNLEGHRRKLHIDHEYVPGKDATLRLGLNEYVLEQAVKKNDPINKAALREFYAAHKDIFTDKKDALLPYESCAKLVHRKLLEDRMEKQLAALGAKLEARYAVQYETDLLEESEAKSPRPLVQSGIMTWTPMDFYTVAQEAGFVERLKESKAERLEILHRVVWERLLNANALAEQVDKTPEFAPRKRFLEHMTLGQFTRDRLMGWDVEADVFEAMAYYDMHSEEFEDSEGRLPPFVDVRDQAKELATKDKRERVAASLADALTWELFPVSINRPEFEKLYGVMRVGQ